MANTSVIRVVGATYALSVTASSHASVLIDDFTNDQINFASFLNPSSVAVAVKFSNLSTCPAAVFPVDGTPGDFVLPSLMEYPIVLAIPTTPFSMTAIGASAGPSVIYVTPAADQS